MRPPIDLRPIGKESAQILKHVLPSVAACALFAANTHAQTPIVGDLTDDRYTYWIVTDGGERELAPLFAFENEEPPAPQFFFTYFDSNLTAKWDVELPPGVGTGTYSVVSATVEVYLRPDDTWDPAQGEILLFAAGFTGDNGFTEETWTENTAYFGPTAFAPGLLDPYPVELGTGDRAEDNPDATPWAVADLDFGSSGDAIRATFDLDIADPAIQSKLIADLEQGFSTWILVSNYLAEQPGGTRREGTPYPNVYTKEAIGSSGTPSNAEAPALTIVIDSATSVGNWHLYQ